VPEDYAAEVGLGAQLPPFVRLQFREFAESYPDIPTLSIIRCLVEVDHESEQVVGDDERAAMALRLARERLDELNGRYRAE